MTKGPNAFRTISEAAEELGVPQHVLRFWETRFSFVKPLKRAGGRRFYRPQDIAVLKGVRHLLHEEGYTIKGVARLQREKGIRRLIAAGDPDAADRFTDEDLADVSAPAAIREPKPMDAAKKRKLEALIKQLDDARAKLDSALGGKRD
jgi:DNA-binding transcriptional MerR regulator